MPMPRCWCRRAEHGVAAPVKPVTRRDAIALLSGAILPARARAPAPLRFASAAAAHGASIPAGAGPVACCAPGGVELLPYRPHPGIDGAFVARFPEAAFVSREGRGYALARDAITVEAFGAVGDGRTNDQPAIQKAIDFAAASGAREVRFGRAVYAVQVPRRTSPVTARRAYDGLPIVVTRSVALVGRPGRRSALLFRNVDGRSLETAWQSVGGAVWRGAGIFLKGVAPGSPERPSVRLTNLDLDGGCNQGRYFGFPARASDGDGWDVTHKGLWSENDRQTGDWIVERSSVKRFRGELLYQGGPDHGAVILRDVEFGITNADILNPCGTRLDIDGGSFHQGFSGWEGWGGRHGRIVNSVFANCRSMGGMQGGRAYTQTHEKGAFARPTAYEAGVKPWLDLDVRIVDCGPVYIGSWVRGRIEAIDSMLAISSRVFPTISDIDLDLVAECRTKSLPAAVSVTNAGNGRSRLSDITVRLTVRNPHGPARFGRALQKFGVASPGVSIRMADETT